MIRKTFPVGPLQCNCTILADPDSREAVVIDPGDEAPKILMKLAEDELKVVAIIHTHAHVDHIGAAAKLAEVTHAPTYLHPEDKFLHDILAEQAMFIGMKAPQSAPIDLQLEDAQAVHFGKYELGVIHTPGHSPGSVCFDVPGHDICFSGDTLFAGGIGRTDLWGGDFDTLEKSIRDRLYALNSAVRVIPGHGPETFIDQERKANPFVRALA